MPTNKIHFFSEDTDFRIKSKTATRHWLHQVIRSEEYKLKELNIIFCSDLYLLNINQTYLQHNTFTDIITFDNSEEEGKIEGDIFISVERVRENANKFKADFIKELNRVIIHGVLHLMGYKDKTEKDKKRMREKEDACLSLQKN